MTSLVINYTNASKQYQSIIKNKRLHSHLRCPQALKQKVASTEQFSEYRKPVQFSKINIFDQSQSIDLKENLRTLQHKKYMTQRFWDGKQCLRVKTEKTCNRGIRSQTTSAKKIVYFRQKSRKVFNKQSRTQKISQLSITKKRLDQRPVTANSRDLWTATIQSISRNRQKQAKMEKSPRLQKKASLLQPW